MTRWGRQIPYVIVLLLSGYLFYAATQIEFTAPGGRIGPTVWPKAVLLLSMLTCAYAIIKNLLSDGVDEVDSSADGDGKLQVSQQPFDGAEQEPEPRMQSYPRLLFLGAALTVAYAALIPMLGFFICTVLFLGAFTWIGRYRRLGTILATSVLGGLVFMYVFMKVVYISLPLGIGPFGFLSLQLMKIMGIR
jgi:putative tricarboxylic transport membrane protein